ncbi:hypothetical protein BZG36_00146 [Bifiguratus adelaidae]|uniref:L domain-like protein n=1 Tax=Bifiguratus adelaidae TaxID=1938954 RepID=A0A261Y8A6_9FUNG|nr:hypothetical protein BZG36_00146 [Bifiguratus adelaidae]
MVAVEGSPPGPFGPVKHSHNSMAHQASTSSSGLAGEVVLTGLACLRRPSISETTHRPGVSFVDRSDTALPRSQVTETDRDVDIESCVDDPMLAPLGLHLSRRKHSESESSSPLSSILIRKTAQPEARIESQPPPLRLADTGTVLKQLILRRRRWREEDLVQWLRQARLEPPVNLVNPLSTRSLTSITDLDLSRNKLTDIPNELTMAMPNLISLNLSYNQLSRFPTSVTAWRRLESLNLGRNQITGSVKASALRELGRLVMLRLDGNQIESFCDDIRDLDQDSQVEYDEFKEMEGNDTAFSSQPFWPKLQVLSLGSVYGGNKLKNLPNHVVAHMPALHELDLSHNRLRNLPSDLGCINSQLRVITATDNHLGNLPSSLQSCTVLTHLHLSRNHLVSLPSTITHLTNLSVLDVSENLLCVLPQDIASFMQTRTLLLTGNPMTRWGVCELNPPGSLNSREGFSSLFRSALKQSIAMKSGYIGYEPSSPVLQSTKNEMPPEYCPVRTPQENDKVILDQHLDSSPASVYEQPAADGYPLSRSASSEALLESADTDAALDLNFYMQGRTTRSSSNDAWTMFVKGDHAPSDVEKGSTDIEEYPLYSPPESLSQWRKTHIVELERTPTPLEEIALLDHQDPAFVTRPGVRFNRHRRRRHATDPTIDSTEDVSSRSTHSLPDSSQSTSNPPPRMHLSKAHTSPLRHEASNFCQDETCPLREGSIEPIGASDDASIPVFKPSSSPSSDVTTSTPQLVPTLVELAERAILRQWCPMPSSTSNWASRLSRPHLALLLPPHLSAHLLRPNVNLCAHCHLPFVNEWVSSLKIQSFKGHPGVVRRVRYCSVACWRVGNEEHPDV